MVVPALESVSADIVRKYYRKARDDMRANKEGYTPGKELEKAVKQYKSRRHIPLKEIN